jgi:hypothetical protein
MPRQIGVTLLETLLALVIAASAIAASLTAIGAYKRMQGITQINNTVSQIMQGMLGYYRANCSSGTLSPATNGTTATVVVLGPANTTIVSWMNSAIVASNGIFNTDATTYKGYIAQYNLHQSSRTPSYAGATTGTIYGFTMQVAVGPLTAKELLTVPKEIGANCTSKLATVGVYPCSSNQPGTYAVLEEIPSASAYGYINATFMPTVKEFKDQYTNDDFYSMQTGGQTGVNYYTCGS